MLLALVSLSMAAPVPQVHPFLPPSHLRAPPPNVDSSGAELLTVSRSGELVVMQDATGEWFNEALSQVTQGADPLEFVLGSIYGAFFQNYEDDYQYLTIMMVSDLGIFFAFYSPMSNDVEGIGYDNFTNRETFDTTDEQIEGMIFMNYYGLWRDNPEQGRYVFAQEFMHRWGSFVEIDAQGVDDTELLGRDTAHWSFWLDTTNSPMEGNTWTDNGDGTWSTDKDAGSTYSDLDLYLMGFIGADEVGTQTLLQVSDEEQEASGYEAASTPIYFADLEQTTRDQTVTATAVEFELDAIIDAEGERAPGVDESPKEFRMAFIVLALSDDEVTDEVLAEVDEVRQTFEADWEEDVLYLANLDTTLDGEPVEEEEDTASPEESPAGGCGCSTPAVPPIGIGMALGALAFHRRRRA